MSYPSCELEEFHLTRLRVEWNEPKEAVSTQLNFSFDYNVSRHTTDSNRYRLSFRMHAKSDTPQPVGYFIDCRIVGFFKFPQDLAKAKMEGLVRVNGCTMLYGILRGQIAGITGSFPGRKFILPAFMMQDVVNEVENRKTEKPALPSGPGASPKAGPAKSAGVGKT